MGDPDHRNRIPNTQRCWGQRRRGGSSGPQAGLLTGSAPLPTGQAGAGAHTVHACTPEGCPHTHTRTHTHTHVRIRKFRASLSRSPRHARTATARTRTRAHDPLKAAGRGVLGRGEGVVQELPSQRPAPTRTRHAPSTPPQVCRAQYCLGGRCVTAGLAPPHPQADRPGPPGPGSSWR